MFLLLLNSDWDVKHCDITADVTVMSCLLFFIFLFLPLTWVLVTVVTDGFTDNRATVVLTWWLTTVPTMQHGMKRPRREHFGWKTKKEQTRILKKKDCGNSNSLHVLWANQKRTTWWCHCHWCSMEDDGFQLKLKKPFLFLTGENHHTPPSSLLPLAHAVTSCSPDLSLFLSTVRFFTESTDRSERLKLGRVTSEM